MENPNENNLPFLTRNMLDFEQGSSFGLRVDCVAHSADPFQIRGFTKAGIFTLVVNPVGDGSVETFNFALPDVPTAITIYMAQASFNAPLAHVIAHLTVNGDRIKLLCQGTIGTLFGLSWPEKTDMTHEQQEGAFVLIQPPQPAVGAEIDIDVPDNEVWEILGIVFSLTCDANAADRTVTLELENPLAFRVTRAPATTQQANESQSYQYVVDGVTGVITANEEQEIRLPPRIFLSGGSTIKSITTNMQEGDQYEAPGIMIRRNYIVGLQT